MRGCGLHRKLANAQRSQTLPLASTRARAHTCSTTPASGFARRRRCVEPGALQANPFSPASPVSNEHISCITRCGSPWNMSGAPKALKVESCQASPELISSYLAGDFTGGQLQGLDPGRASSKHDCKVQLVPAHVWAAPGGKDLRAPEDVASNGLSLGGLKWPQRA
jgi:hypothetical protein